MNRIKYGCFVWLLLATVLHAEDSAWKLAWQDDFERTEIGKEWYLHRGKARIADGRLYMHDVPTTMLVERGFAPDVKLEFIAEADPKAPPCDLAAALASSRYWGYTYMLAFGGNNNRDNYLHGVPKELFKLTPLPLIQHGKKYKLTAVKEGAKIAYYVDGVKILEGEEREPLGGPEFDRLGLVTWNGMYVDEVKVYERATPAEGGPVILRAMPDVGYTWKDRRLVFRGGIAEEHGRGMGAYNEKNYDEAFRIFLSETPASLGTVVCLAYVIGDLAYQERPGDQRKLAELANEVAKRSPEDKKAQDFARAAEWFRRITITSRDHRAVSHIVAMGPENNPFFHKAMIYRARYQYAHGAEAGDKARKQEALDIFASLKTLWPENETLRQFSGEKIAWGKELIHAESSGPAWARYLQEAFARQQAILTWWFTKRQAPDGQLGGGWGDDVELMRTWVPVACITTGGETAVAGIERMVEGLWKKVLKDGFEPEIGDVEHTAEPSCDPIPHMILLRYGDPRFVEYNLRSAKTVREKFMALNQRGFLQFISAEFGTNGVNTSIEAGGDTGYHARAMKHFTWLGWYGIPEARAAYVQWCDAWRDVTMAKIGSKPPGFMPASIFYPSGGIDPPTGKPWHDDRSHYYGFGGLPWMIHDCLLTGYYFSGDRKFLEPFQTLMDLATLGPKPRTDSNLPRDHINNLLADLAELPTAKQTAVYRWLTGERVYDGYTLRLGGSPTQRYQIDYDLAKYGESFQETAEKLRYNLASLTSEVLQTDRAGLPGSWDVLGAYTGAVRDLMDGATPTLAVTWDTADLNFAAVVTEATPQRLRVRLFNFNDGPAKIGLRPWRLSPGVYVLNSGEPMAGESSQQERYRWTEPKELEHRWKGTPIRLEVPSKKEWVVDLRLRRSIERPMLLPDLAIHARDIRMDGAALRVNVHNIGGAAAGPFVVALQTRQDGKWVETGRAEVEGLPAISQFNPVMREVEIPVAAEKIASGIRVVVDPEEKVDEIYELNNSVETPKSQKVEPLTRDAATPE